MATTVKHQPPTHQYITVVNSTTEEFFIQNIGHYPVYVIWANTVPAADSKGHVLQPGDAVIRGGFTGNLYARSITKDSIVAVTVEPAA